MMKMVLDMNHIRASEPWKVLAFVVVPLVLLLALGLALRSRFVGRTTAMFNEFSIAISRLGPEDAIVTRKRENRKQEFAAEITGKRQIDVHIPSELDVAEVHSAVADLVQGFQKLGYEYLIYKKGEREPIPESEREAAISELNKMGFEVQRTEGRIEVRRASQLRGAASSQPEANITTPEWIRLLGKAKGVRERIEVLAKSDAAVDRIEV